MDFHLSLIGCTSKLHRVFRYTQRNSSTQVVDEHWYFGKGTNKKSVAIQSTTLFHSKVIKDPELIAWL